MLASYTDPSLITTVSVDTEKLETSLGENTSVAKELCGATAEPNCHETEYDSPGGPTLACRRAMDDPKSASNSPISDESHDCCNDLNETYNSTDDTCPVDACSKTYDVPPDHTDKTCDLPCSH